MVLYLPVLSGHVLGVPLDIILYKQFAKATIVSHNYSMSSTCRCSLCHGMGALCPLTANLDHDVLL